MYGIRNSNEITNSRSVRREMMNLLSILEENKLLNQDFSNPIDALYDLTVGLLDLIEKRKDWIFEYESDENGYDLKSEKEEIEFIEDLIFFDEGEISKDAKKKFLLLCMECDLRSRESLKLLKLSKYNLFEIDRGIK